nr:hypothetical protein [Tanacetum cinerariifolium]
MDSDVAHMIAASKGVNTANGVNTASSQVNAASSLNIDNLSNAVICAFLASQPNSTQLVNEDLEQIHPDNLGEMDLKWQMAMLTMRARRFLKNTGRKLNLNGDDYVAFNKTKVECYNYHKRGHFARECWAPRGQDNRSRDVTRKTMPIETPNSLALKTCDAPIIEDWVSDEEEEEVEKKEVKPSINRINFIKATTDNNPRETVQNAVNAAKAKAKYNVVKGKRGNVVKASACWTTVKIKTINDDVRLQALVNGKKVVITEASIRHDLKLNDAEGTSCLSNAAIFEELARREDHVLTTSNDPLPIGEDRMQLKELMDLCINLSNNVLDLENKVIEMKSSHKAKITELERRLEKLEEENRSLTKELKSFNTRVKSPAIKETIVDKEESFKQGRKIANIDADAEVNLKNVYNLDMAHKETVLILLVELNAANEEPVSAAPTNITTAQPSEATKTTVDISTTLKAKGIVFHDKEESTTRTASSKSQVKEKGKAKIEAEWNADIKDNIDLNEVVEQVQSRQSDARLDLYLKKNTIRFKPCSRKAQRWIQKGLKLQEREQEKRKWRKIKLLKSKGDELEHDNTEKQKLEEQQDNEELKNNLEIVPNDEDDVFVNVTPLSSKPPTIVDYKIYKEGKKENFQIIRANGNHQMYLAFNTMLKNFDREDLEVL